MAYQVSHKALKAMLFHWITNYWHIKALAKGQVSYVDVVDEMTMLNMADLVQSQPTVVYGAYKEACEFSKDYIGNHL